VRGPRLCRGFFFVMRRLHRIYFAVLLVCAANALTWAESGILVVHVEDVQERPIAGVQIGVKGDGGYATTGHDGKARIPLAKQTRANSEVDLQILGSPPGKDFVMVSPWERKALVPSFENESKNFVEVVIIQRGELAALKSGTVLKALTAQINKATAPGAQKIYIVSLTETLAIGDSVTASKNNFHPPPKEEGQRTTEQQKQAALADVASSFGIPAEEIDKAIRAWGAKVTDPYEAGLAALYERNYPKASAQLTDSLQKREEKLAADRKAVADAAFFLGQSLYEEGKYRESATAYQRSLQLRPDDAVVLNNLGLSLIQAGDYAGAEPLCRRVLAADEEAPGLDHPDLATHLNNLAFLLKTKGDYAGAEPLYRRALAINDKALGPNDPRVATSLNNLAMLLAEQGDFAGAEPLFRRALSILEKKALGPNDPTVATALNNLAELLAHEDDFAGAEPLFRRALSILEEALGPNHPTVATALNNLGGLLAENGDLTGAEPLYRRALEIDEHLGPEHPDVATDLNNLGALLEEKGDLAGAEPLYQRALAICEKALGPNHPHTQQLRQSLKALSDRKSAEKPEK